MVIHLAEFAIQVPPLRLQSRAFHPRACPIFSRGEKAQPYCLTYDDIRTPE